MFDQKTKDPEREAHKRHYAMFGAACTLYDQGRVAEAKALVADKPDLLERLDNRKADRAKAKAEREARWAASRREDEERRVLKTSCPITRVIETPMEDLRFRDFASLKVPGKRDAYSSMRRPKLRAALSLADLAAIDEALPDSDKLQDTACRWVLRGLPVDKAIRKVKTDAEVTDNAIHSYYREVAS